MPKHTIVPRALAAWALWFCAWLLQSLQGVFSISLLVLICQPILEYLYKPVLYFVKPITCPQFPMSRHCAGDEMMTKVIDELKICSRALTALQERGRLEAERSLLQVRTTRAHYGPALSESMKTYP